MPERDHAALVELLEAEGLNPCPACGNPDWLIGPDPVFVPFVEKENFPGWRAVVLFCSNCGLMHLHNYGVLLTKSKVAEGAEEQDEEADDAD